MELEGEELLMYCGMKHIDQDNILKASFPRLSTTPMEKPTQLFQKDRSLQDNKDEIIAKVEFMMLSPRAKHC